MPRPAVLHRWEERGAERWQADHCRWWPDFWLDVFTPEQYRRLLLLRWLIERGRVSEWERVVSQP